MTNLETLVNRVAELEARLAAVSATPHPEPPMTPVAPTPWVFTPPPTKALALIAPQFQPLNVRQVRQLAAAVAISKGEPLPLAGCKRSEGIRS